MGIEIDFKGFQSRNCNINVFNKLWIQLIQAVVSHLINYLTILPSSSPIWIVKNSWNVLWSLIYISGLIHNYFWNFFVYFFPLHFSRQCQSFWTLESFSHTLVWDIFKGKNRFSCITNELEKWSTVTYLLILEKWLISARRYDYESGAPGPLLAPSARPPPLLIAWSMAAVLPTRTL